MDNGSLILFWCFWILTLLLGCWQVVRAWRQPQEMFGFATIAAVFWLYFYGYLPYYLVVSQRAAFPAHIWNLAQFTAFSSLVSLLAGWHMKLRGNRRSGSAGPNMVIDFNRLWWCGVGALLIGLGGFYSFLASNRDAQNTSAYWYLLCDICYPGMALCVVTMTLSPRHRSVTNWAIFAVLAAMIILPNLIGARRGPTYVAIIVVFFSYASVRLRPIRPEILLAVLCVTGLVLVTLVTARRVTYSEGGTWSEYFKTFDISEVTSKRAQKSSDNEYYNHCQVIQANINTGLYQYGTVHLAVFLNWIPRSVWPGKPQRSTGFFPEAFQTLEHSEDSNLGSGGAWGAVADSFNNYWYFFPLFWLVIGWGTAAMFLKAQDAEVISGKLYNVGLLGAAHWFIGQSFSEAFVPFMIFEAVFWIALRHSCFEFGQISDRERRRDRMVRRQNGRRGVNRLL